MSEQFGSQASVQSSGSVSQKPAAQSFSPSVVAPAFCNDMLMNGPLRSITGTPLPGSIEAETLPGTSPHDTGIFEDVHVAVSNTS
jgi:hypothetical protein